MEPADESLPSSPRRIFVPTDFSEYAHSAILAAYGLLSAEGGEVRLLHVEVPDRVRAYSAQEDEAILERLRALEPAWAVSRHITTTVAVVHRLQLADAILEEAEAFSADLICIGSQGRTGLARALLGSVAGDVLRKCRLPLLVVPPRKTG